MLARVKSIYSVLICNVGANRVLKDSIGDSFPLYVVPRNPNICSTLESEGSLFLSAIIVRVVVSGRFSARYCILSHCVGS